jgi:hypothetical protein
MAGIQLHREGKMTARALAMLAEGLSVAATVPGGMHDDVQFMAAVARRLGSSAGSA